MDINQDIDHLEGLMPTAWPSSDADLLAEDDDWWFVACIDWQQGQWHGYVEGFRQAAHLIVNQIHSTAHGQDTLIFPFLTSWRHYAEIQLKSLITYLHTYLEQPSESLKKTHRIDELWRTTRALLEEAGCADDSDELDHVQRVLRQLHALDPTAQHFRYPVTVNGAPTLAGVRRIHMRRFHEAMEGVACFLDAAETGISSMLDLRSEHEAEMAREADW
ncbi:hypothetical protein ACQP1V_06320 [Microtetraspora malaysiensis]|uniref:hypothetical protein n=1 Tax=Microtetraspora malaysiensis TaxID=161358 RepID=UPI003D93C61A